MKIINSEKGLSIIELLVVIAIVGIMSLVVTANYRAGEKRLALERSTHKLAQDIRRTGEMAMSARECKTCDPPEVPPGYGIYFDLSTNPDGYLIYADTEGASEFYTSLDETVESLSLEKGIYIKEILTGKVGINFRPPDPTIKIKYQELDSGEDSVQITLGIEGDLTQEKTIVVNKAGLIDID